MVRKSLLSLRPMLTNSAKYPLCVLQAQEAKIDSLGNRQGVAKGVDVRDK